MTVRRGIWYRGRPVIVCRKTKPEICAIFRHMKTVYTHQDFTPLPVRRTMHALLTDLYMIQSADVCKKTGKLYFSVSQCNGVRNVVQDKNTIIFLTRITCHVRWMVLICWNYDENRDQCNILLETCVNHFDNNYKNAVFMLRNRCGLLHETACGPKGIWKVSYCWNKLIIAV